MDHINNGRQDLGVGIILQVQHQDKKEDPTTHLHFCLLCSYSNKNRSIIGHHLKNMHRVLKGMENEHFKVVTETSMDCALCSLSITKNECQIKVHLTRAHNMTMEEYAAKFVHGDSKVEDAVPAQATNEDIKVPKNVMW